MNKFGGGRTGVCGLKGRYRDPGTERNGQKGVAVRYACGVCCERALKVERNMSNKGAIRAFRTIEGLQIFSLQSDHRGKGTQTGPLNVDAGESSDGVRGGRIFSDVTCVDTVIGGTLYSGTDWPSLL